MSVGKRQEEQLGFGFNGCCLGENGAVGGAGGGEGRGRKIGGVKVEEKSTNARRKTQRWRGVRRRGV